VDTNEIVVPFQVRWSSNSPSELVLEKPDASVWQTELSDFAAFEN
jgi:hypothetical protein